MIGAGAKTATPSRFQLHHFFLFQWNKNDMRQINKIDNWKCCKNCNSKEQGPMGTRYPTYFSIPHPTWFSLENQITRNVGYARTSLGISGTSLHNHFAHYLKKKIIPEIPIIHGNSLVHIKYLELPDQIFWNSYPSRTRLLPEFFQYPTRTHLTKNLPVGLCQGGFYCIESFFSLSFLARGSTPMRSGMHLDKIKWKKRWK